jgi:hypothetical protein
MSEGKTIWEMLREKAKGQPTIPFFDPLSQPIGGMFVINKPCYEGYDFSIAKIREYTRRLGGKNFTFTDYVLKGTKNFDNETAIAVRLRVIPNESGINDVVLLRLYDDLPFDEGLKNIVENKPEPGKTNEFEVSYDEGEKDGNGVPRHEGDTETYTRLNNLTDSYQCDILIINGQDAKNHEALVDQIERAELEYWDYWREVEDGNRKYPQFLFVEMNSKTGWFQIWQGEPYYI